MNFMPLRRYSGLNLPTSTHNFRTQYHREPDCDALRSNAKSTLSVLILTTAGDAFAMHNFLPTEPVATEIKQRVARQVQSGCRKEYPE